jgi:type II secretory pathway component PulM
VSSALDWYRARPANEQRTLLLGGAALLLILLTFGWLQLHGRVVATEERVTAKRRDLAWLQPRAPQVAALNSQRGGAGNESLLVVIDRVARNSGVAGALAGSQQAGPDGAYRVRLEKAPFDATVAFLGQLALQYNVSVDSAGIDATGESGLVNAALVLRKP